MVRERFVPEGYKLYSPEIGDAYPKDMFACYTNLEQPHNPKAMFFIGKQSKAVWYYRFPTVVEMGKKINETISKLMAIEDRKAKRKAERIEARKNMDVSSIKLGDIFHWSGGYNCTRNSYVKVVGFAGKNKLSVIDLPKTQVDGDWMNGNVAPVVDFMNVEEAKIFHIRVGYNGELILRDTKGYKDNYYKWNGKPNWENCD